MAEIWELVDEQKRKTGILHERAYSEQIPKGFYHIVVEIWTKTRDGELLLTQRHPQKPMGLLWECTMGSVVVGEESREGAARELAEETGIYAREEDLIYLGDTFHSNWIVDSYLYLPEEKPALRLQKEEVVNAEFVKLSDMDKRQSEIVDGVWMRFCKFREKIESYT